jgi:hypothetical protein
MWGLYLFVTPRILQIGAVVLVGSAAAGIISMAAPAAAAMPYCVLGVFAGFSGICLLLLFNPPLLYMKLHPPPQPSSE